MIVCSAKPTLGSLPRREAAAEPRQTEHGLMDEDSHGGVEGAESRGYEEASFDVHDTGSEEDRWPDDCREEQRPACP